MSITADSTVEEIWDYVGRPGFRSGEVEVDVSDWSILDCDYQCTYLAAENYTLKFGGFVFDAFDDFAANCAIATNTCTIDTDNYDGWAQGIYTRF